MFAILALFGSARAFMMPASQAVLKNLVPDREFESGVTAGWLGLVRAILLGAAATLAVTGLWAAMFPVLTRMDRFPHHQKEAKAETA